MSVMLEGTFREAVPLHFLFKIESFSMLSNSFVKFESNVFETGGYKWKLSLYPNGNTNENGFDHISLYLLLVDTSLPDWWELTVLFKLFLYDHIRQRYFFRGANPFHDMKKVWGFPQFLSLEDFNDPAYGYLLDDTCVFGAEVFVTKPPGKIERLSLAKPAITVNYTWKINNFSNISDGICSEIFKAGNYYWYILICPKGYSYSKYPYEPPDSASLYLSLSDCERDSRLQVWTNFKLRLMDQLNVKNIEFSVDRQMFSISSKRVGLENFIRLDEMKDIGKGYLVNDTCIVEAEVEVLGVVSKGP